VSASDPVVRYTAGAIMVLAFTASLAVLVHGYWDNPSYTVPPLIAGIVLSAVTGAAGALGVHLGGQAAVGVVTTGGKQP
jgi:hypothetical protein